MSNNFFNEELEVLQAIYMDDILIEENEAIQGSVALTMTLHPSTADEDDKKYVCLTLIFVIPKQYPDKIPQISIKNPRGLSDAHINSIQENLHALAASRINECMIFELIEYAKESLTDNNCPSCECSICLDNFKDERTFYRTDCYHYFHMFCIQSYFKTVDKKLCPVCRLEVSSPIDLAAEYEPPISNDDTYQSTDSYKQWQKECQRLYSKQQKKGGIIDLEEERNKFLVTADTTFTIPDRNASYDQTDEAPYNCSSNESKQTNPYYVKDDLQYYSKNKKYHSNKNSKYPKREESSEGSSKRYTKKNDKHYPEKEKYSHPHYYSERPSSSRTKYADRENYYPDREKIHGDRDKCYGDKAVKPQTDKTKIFTDKDKNYSDKPKRYTAKEKSHTDKVKSNSDKVVRTQKKELRPGTNYRKSTKNPLPELNNLDID